MTDMLTRVWNPVRGCSKGNSKLADKTLNAPMRWLAPYWIVVDSKNDLFDENVPTKFIDRVFAVMALCPLHKFEIRTKRPERMLAYVSATSTDRGDTWSTAAARVERLIAAEYFGLPRGTACGTPAKWPLANVKLGEQREGREKVND